jgi:hypothetical protein
MASQATARPAPRLDRAVVVLAGFLPALACVALLAALLLVVAPATVVSDTWLDLVSAREIVEHGLPHHDHLTVLGQGRTWTDQQWLGQLALYAGWKVGGLSAVVALGIGLVLLSYGLAVGVHARRGADPVLLTLLFVLVVAADPWALQVRTQSMGILGFVLICLLLLSDPEAARYRTLLVLPILAVWANVHGSVVLGAGVVVAYGVVATVKGAGARALPYVLAAPLCVFLSPYFLSLLDYYRLMLVDPPFRGLVVEWRPAGLSPAFAGFYVLVALVTAVVIRFRRRYELFEVVLLAITAAAAFAAVRNIVWFALAALLVLPRHLRLGRALEERPAGVLAGALAVAVLAMLAVAAARPPGYYSARGLTGTAVAAASEAVDRSPGPVYADDEHADWLLWSVPATRGRVAYDSRLEILRRQDLARLATVADGRGDYGRVLDRYALAVVSPRLGRAFTRIHWGRILFRDRTTSILRRSSAHARQ